MSPLSLRGHELPNRVVFTAHTASFSEDGVPGTRARAYYEARAAGGAALIVMEPLPVLPSAGVTPQNYRFDDERFVPGLRAVADAVHAHGTTLVSQLYHLGPNADPTATMRPLWSVSGGPPPDGGPGRMREIDERDIDELVAAHVRGARAALAGGADGVECMFAYDTLVDGFMSERRNERADGYGGSLEHRMRLAREILDVLRDAIGPEPLLGVTLTASMPGYVAAVAHLAERCDVDYFGIGNGDYEHLELLMPSLDFEPGFGVQFADAVKRDVPGACVIAEGRITTPEIAERALREGRCDLVGMTRAQIADPDLVRKARDGLAADIRHCVGLNLCVARRLKKFPIACVQNPDAGLEARRPPRGDHRRVVVIGGGVAGLEAARAAAGAGHTVTLFERSDRLGGQVALTAGLPFQEAHASLIDWRIGELERLGVTIELGIDVDPDVVSSLEPDIAFVATGSAPDGRYDAAVSSVEVLEGAVVPTGPVVVIDEEGHRKASGVAELLASRGHEVTIVGDGIAPAALLEHSLAARPTLRRLHAAGVRLLPHLPVVSVEPGRVRIEAVGGVEDLEATVIVHAGRHRAVSSLVEALRSAGVAVTAIGDAWAPRLVEDAIRSGYDAARALGASARQPDTIAT